ncbi:MAG: alpha/beta hydrolase [bacterium]|nr:alpha/beta hydrolase [bacterium]
MEENKVSRQGRLMRRAIARLTKENLIGQKFKNGEIRKRIVEPAAAWKCPECFTNTIVELKNCTAELLEYTEPNREKVILQLHGGGYIGSMRHAYRSFAGLYNEVSKRYSVFTPDYRVAPEYVFPAALEDALDAFDWLLNAGYTEDQIIVVGDSAGGGLSLALCLYLKDHKRKLPCGLVLMSPWTDMTASGESYQTNYENDPLFGGTDDSMIWNREYAADEDLTNPYLSPLYGNYTDFPPMLIQVGSCEMLLSDSTMLAQKAKDAGVKVRLSVYEGMFHVFEMAPLALPECRRAWVEIGHFMSVMTNPQWDENAEGTSMDDELTMEDTIYSQNDGESEDDEL